MGLVPHSLAHPYVFACHSSMGWHRGKPEFAENPVIVWVNGQAD